MRNRDNRSWLSPRGIACCLGVLIWVILLGGCTAVLSAKQGYDARTTDPSGAAVLRVASGEIRVNVVDETGLPVSGITVEAFVLKGQILVVAGGEDYYPAFQVIPAASLASSATGRLEPELAITTVTLMVIAAVNIALIAYDYYRNPGEFPVQIPGLIEGDRRVRSVCLQIDANDGLALWNLFSSTKLLYRGIHVLGAPAKLRGVEAMKVGMTKKRVVREVAALGAERAMKAFREFAKILDSDVITTCQYYYDTGAGEVEMPYMTFDVRRVFAESRNHLYAISPSRSGVDVLIGAIQTTEGSHPDITDIALDENTGVLWGISFSHLYRIDPLTGQAIPVGSGLGVGNANALAVGPGGQLFSATIDGWLITVDRTSGRATTVGPYGGEWTSSGDLAFRSDGVLFGTSGGVSGRQGDVLLRVSPSSGTAIEVGDIGYPNVYGLFFVENRLYGVTAGSELLLIDPETGRGTLVRRLSFSAWGAQEVEMGANEALGDR